VRRAENRRGPRNKSNSGKLLRVFLTKTRCRQKTCINSETMHGPILSYVALHVFMIINLLLCIYIYAIKVSRAFCIMYNTIHRRLHNNYYQLYTNYLPIIIKSLSLLLYCIAYTYIVLYSLRSRFPAKPNNTS